MRLGSGIVRHGVVAARGSAYFSSVPLLLVPAIVLMALIVGVALMPIGLVQRYRAGTTRRAARGWLTTLNVGALAFSVLIFLGSAAVTSVWVPKAFVYSLAGLAAGCILGILGLRLTKWELEPQRLHYTPNRYLVLMILLIVAGRLVYGAWRLWQGWPMSGADRTWVLDSGRPGSMAAGALVLGYTFTFWIGIARQISRSKKRRTA